MQLITMAHSGEALSVIEKWKLKKTSPDVFIGESHVLLLTGEGPFEAAVKTAALIPLYPFKEVINAGIAGSLKPELEIGDVITIRTIYIVKDLKPQFKTFQAGDQGEDCLTSFERLLDTEKTTILRGLGGVVDREAWGVAMAAKNAGLPFRCLKVISDQAGTLGACEVIKEKASYFSDLLANALTASAEAPASETKVKLEGFHFTFTMEHQLKNLLRKVSLREEISEEEVLKELHLSEINPDSPPKERARLLIQHLEERIDPLKKELNTMMAKLQLEFRKQGIDVHFDPTWERPTLKLSFDVKDNRDLEDLSEKLKQLDIQSFSNSMKGIFHVE